MAGARIGRAGIATDDQCAAPAGPTQVALVTATVSTRQPAWELLESLPIRQRNWTVCPAALAGRFTTVGTNAPVVPVHAERPAIGLLNALEIVPVYAGNKAAAGGDDVAEAAAVDADLEDATVITGFQDVVAVEGNLCAICGDRDRRAVETVVEQVTRIAGIGSVRRRVRDRGRRPRIGDRPHAGARIVDTLRGRPTGWQRGAAVEVLGQQRDRSAFDDFRCQRVAGAKISGAEGRGVVVGPTRTGRRVAHDMSMGARVSRQRCRAVGQLLVGRATSD